MDLFSVTYIKRFPETGADRLVSVRVFDRRPFSYESYGRVLFATWSDLPST